MHRVSLRSFCVAVHYSAPLARQLLKLRSSFPASRMSAFDADYPRNVIVNDEDHAESGSHGAAGDDETR